MHTCAGYFALLLCCVTILGWRKNTTGKFRLSDFLRIGSLYYLTLILTEIVSPASDYYAMCLVFYIILRWVDLLESKECAILPYSLLCIVCIFAITIKVSTVPLLILTIKPAIALIKQKQFKNIFIYIMLGILCAMPFLIRGVIISGWLLYPSTLIDLFPVPWKIPKELVDGDKILITLWGRALYNYELYNLSFLEWFPIWIHSLKTSLEKLIIIADIVSIILLLINSIFLLFRKDKHWDLILLNITIISSFCFWLFSAPLMRYGYAYCLILLMLLAFEFYSYISYKSVTISIYVLAVVFLIYKGIKVSENLSQYIACNNYFYQQDYAIFEVIKKEDNDFIYYVPATGDKVGYYDFPATPADQYYKLDKKGFLPK